MNNFEELLDVVDQYDQVIAVHPRWYVYEHKLYFRAINAFIINSKGQLWIPIRSAAKKLFPNALDASVGGHVSAGERYADAMARETFEETGMQLQVDSLEMIGRLTPVEHGVSAFMHLYIIRTDQTPQYNTDDFSGYAWLTPDEVLARIAAGQAAKNDLPKIITYLKKINFF